MSVGADASQLPATIAIGCGGRTRISRPGKRLFISTASKDSYKAHG
ncbi:hypothetical protein [Caudoviricetes sp.]|nr:hypothetical protein [Caudoviricetes sp.]